MAKKSMEDFTWSAWMEGEFPDIKSMLKRLMEYGNWCGCTCFVVGDLLFMQVWQSDNGNWDMFVPDAHWRELAAFGGEHRLTGVWVTNAWSFYREEKIDYYVANLQRWYDMAKQPEDQWPDEDRWLIWRGTCNIDFGPNHRCHSCG